MADGSPDDLVELYRAGGLPEAQALYFRLQEAGIPARIDNEMLQGVIGEVPAGWYTAPRVLVGRERLDAARDILREFLSLARPPAGEADDAGLRCLACGVAMGSADKCPACDWSFAADMDEPPSLPEPAGPAPAPSATTPAEAPVADSGHPARAPRDLWLEVAAVVAVGVIPPLIAAITILAETKPVGPYWSNCLSVTGLGICTAFVVLYLIHRSGEPWERFGVDRPSGWDIPLGFGMLVVAEFVWLVYVRFGLESDNSAYPFPVARGVAEHTMMVILLAANAFSEELITRAYLITRLEVLLRSRGKAVVMAATAFASYHLYQGLPGVVFVFMLGLAYGAAYLGVRRVWPLAIGHMLYDIHVELSYLPRD